MLTSLFPLDSILLIDIGCYTDPIFPASLDSNIHVLAFEANISIINQIKHRNNLHLLPIAVSDKTSLTEFHIYNNGLSSSLSVPSFNDSFWTSDNLDGSTVIVPSLSLSSILQSIDSTINISYLKSDIQGLDLEVIKSAGDLIKRIPYLKTEVFLGNFVSYKNSHNDFCRDWLPYMTDLGYEIYSLELVNQKYSFEFQDAFSFCEYDLDKGSPDPIAGRWEGNAFWKILNTESPAPPVSSVNWPV